MNYISGITYALLFSTAIFAQQKDDVAYFNQGMELIDSLKEELHIEHQILKYISYKSPLTLEAKVLTKKQSTILEQAATCFNKLLSNHPKSSQCLTSLTMITGIYLELGKVDKAIAINKKVLAGPYIDPKADNILVKDSLTVISSIKNTACFNLAQLHIALKDFESALFYLDEVSKYDYGHMCGNGQRGEEMDLLTLKAESYYGLDQKSKALEIALPKLFKIWGNNNRLVELSVRILLADYEATFLLKNFKKACYNYYYPKQNKHSDMLKHIKFMDNEIMLPFDVQQRGPVPKEDIDKVIRNAYFFKLLNGAKIAAEVRK